MVWIKGFEVLRKTKEKNDSQQVKFLSATNQQSPDGVLSRRARNLIETEIRVYHSDG